MVDDRPSTISTGGIFCLARNPLIGFDIAAMKTLLLISQVYVPDPAAVGQYMAAAAEAMAARGTRVIVFTADRGYDDPTERFPAHEELNGVEVIRLTFSSLGKKTILHRLVGHLSFCAQAFFRGLFMRELDGLFVTTSPPMGSAVGWAISLLRGTPFAFWVMDINPDQAIALGHAAPGSLPVKVFNWFNRRVLKRAHAILPLDRFMAETLHRKLPNLAPKTHEVPPWPMEDYLERIEHVANPFRAEHNLEGKFVIMYSGNHSIAHPLDTLLEAALHLKDHPKLVFMFIGGGKAKEPIDAAIAEHQPPNIRSLPYQPLDQIKYSLSAADVHIVAMGADMVGIVHPCKFYGAMALAKPVLLVGPSSCHIGEVLKEHDCGWAIDHDQVDAAEQLLRSLPDTAQNELDAKGQRGRAAIESTLSKDHIAGSLCTLLEEMLNSRNKA